MPVRVKGYTSEGSSWDEIGTSEDASRGGVALRIGRHVETGQLVLLTLPMPPHLRLYDENLPTYTSYGRVRSVLTFEREHLARVRLIGKNPPRGRASARSETDPSLDDRDRRHLPRYDVFMNLRLGRLPANGGQSECTVTENLSVEGARVPTSFSVAPGETVTIAEMDGDFQTQAVTCGSYVGNDRVRRINLHFRDTVPRRLIAPAGSGL
jgi:hypothetical protein